MQYVDRSLSEDSVGNSTKTEVVVLGWREYLSSLECRGGAYCVEYELTLIFDMCIAIFQRPRCFRFQQLGQLGCSFESKTVTFHDVLEFVVEIDIIRKIGMVP
jgi:hypothetical protein